MCVCVCVYACVCMPVCVLAVYFIQSADICQLICNIKSGQHTWQDHPGGPPHQHFGSLLMAVYTQRGGRGGG